MMIDHEESFNTHHGAFNSNEFEYDMTAKHWINKITRHHILIDVHDPHQEPKKAIFATNPGNIAVNAQWDIVYCDSDSLEWALKWEHDLKITFIYLRKYYNEKQL